ncbi:MAG TPA: 23S rRNA (pseudouridine(1915)-N(3))-methyltransferase RlmH [Quisquiliibacterium sp.]|nr:23S rRNA (pseudouridine(1915)-N(3))-methyltransferase RlmH [Quisquiliibacterium sp.]
MLIRIIAVGTKMPAWVQTAVDDYTGRMPAEFRVEWREVRAEQRSAGATPAVWMAREAQRIRAALPAGASVVVLDEHGADLTTRDLAGRLQRWQREAQPVAILIGGPDGLDEELKAQGRERLRLSSLTLPHPLVRVLLAEQLYRAWSVLANHPYHRD